MTFRVLMLLTAALLLHSGTAFGVQDSLEGTWQAISLQDGGRTAPDEIVEGLRWIITADAITFDEDGRMRDVAYVVDPTQTPHWMDITDGGRTMLGIYQLDGDTLTVCFAEGRGRGRSTAFESLPDSENDLLIVFRRERP